jgi:hypothetical protein
VVISDDDDVLSLTSSSNGDHPNIVPPALMSAGLLYLDADDGLVTPGVAPESSSGWPGLAIFVQGMDDNSLRNSMDGRDADVNVDEFITSANPGFATVHSIAGCNMGPLVCSAL